jgi:hypothetical protein
MSVMAFENGGLLKGAARDSPFLNLPIRHVMGIPHYVPQPQLS